MKDFKMKYFVIILLFSATSISYAEEVSFEKKLELAEKTLMLNPPKKVFTAQSRQAKHPLIKQIIAKADFDSINKQAAEFMAGQFTYDELKALFDFQHSELGKSITAKMPKYQKLVGAIIQKELQDTLRTEMQGQKLNKQMIQDYTNNPNQIQGGGSPVGR